MAASTQACARASIVPPNLLPRRSLRGKRAAGKRPAPTHRPRCRSASGTRLKMASRLAGCRCLCRSIVAQLEFTPRHEAHMDLSGGMARGGGRRRCVSLCAVFAAPPLGGTPRRAVASSRELRGDRWRSRRSAAHRRSTRGARCAACRSLRRNGRPRASRRARWRGRHGALRARRHAGGSFQLLLAGQEPCRRADAQGHRRGTHRGPRYRARLTAAGAFGNQDGRAAALPSTRHEERHRLRNRRQEAGIGPRSQGPRSHQAQSPRSDGPPPHARAEKRRGPSSCWKIPMQTSRRARGSYSYQNVNTALMGEVLERVYGKPLQDLLSEKIWAPAGATPAECASLWCRSFRDAPLLHLRAADRLAAGRPVPAR